MKESPLNQPPELTPADYLRRAFLERKKGKPAYSTRAFARDLGMSQALLSLVMNEKQALSIRLATQVSAVLGYSEVESKDFFAATLRALPMSAKLPPHIRERMRKRAEGPAKDTRFEDLDLERFTVIANWYHFAIADLMCTSGAKSDPHWISRRLGITAYEARDGISRLLRVGVLERDPRGKLRKTEARIFLEPARSEAVVRSFHKQMITKALGALDDPDPGAFECREISGVVIPADPKRLPEAMRRIREFQKELACFLSEGASSEVMQLNVQLFPLTSPKKGK